MSRSRSSQASANVHDQMVRPKGAFTQTVKGLKNVLASPLYVMTNTTMLRTNAQTIPATLDFLAEMGVPTIGLNALIHAGRGTAVGTGLAESELISPAGGCPSKDRKARSTAHLVHAHPIL